MHAGWRDGCNPIHIMRTRLIRQRLLRQRSQLLARYRDELERADEELATREPEDVERATEQWDAEVLSRLGDADARALGEVVAALHRLDEGTYGICTSCSEEIGEARLDALPTTQLCYDCADTERPTLRRVS